MSKLCLKSVSVRGQVTGKFATFAVEQTYENQSDKVLEVTYCFPLSRTATVTGFRALVGEKVIHGAVKEKSEARKEYQQALVRGNSAYMATKEESNIFKMAIGKIAAGETVRVTLDYVDIVDVMDMKMRVVVPTLVAPRYASATTETLKYNFDEVEYRATIEIVFNPALGITDFDSPSHTIKICENTVVASNIKLNRDFVLEAALKEKSATAAWQYPLRNGNRLLYLSFLPLLSQNEERQPRDFVFVIDISGSMGGEKLRQTKAAVQKCLQSLSAKDRFNIITFESSYYVYNKELIEATSENLSKAMCYVAGLETLGGTEMEAPVREAIEKFGDGKIIFFFTDGQIGYEDRIADYVREKISRNSLFIFGIDTSVNMSGLEKIANAGRGKAEFIVKEDQIKEVVTKQFERATNNKLWDVDINGKSNRVLEKIERQSVIFDNEPYDVLLEVEKEVRDDVELVCRCGDVKHVFGISKDAIQTSDFPFDKIYYAEKIHKIEKYFSHSYGADNSGYEKEIVAIAVENQIDSKYTAFIAVNERDEKITDVPVYQDTKLEAPAGWDPLQINCCSRPAFRCKRKASHHSYYPTPDENVQMQVRETLARLLKQDMENKTGVQYKRVKRDTAADGIWIDEYGVKYSANRKKLISCPRSCNLATYTILAGCEEICENAFMACSRLESLTIPSSVTKIGEMAFFGCNKLTVINVSWDDPNRVSGLIHFPDNAVFYLPDESKVAKFYRRIGLKVAEVALA